MESRFKSWDIKAFPKELSSAVEGLNNENRQKILLTLYPQSKLSFSEIVEKTGIEDSLLSNHLRILKDTVLLEHFYEHVVGQEEYSFYKLSKYGRRILNNLFSVFYVIKHKREIELHLKITDEVTAVSPDMYLSTDDSTKELNDTAEEIKKVIDEFISM